MHKSGKRIVIIGLLLSLALFSFAGCSQTGIRIIPLGSRHVLTLKADDVVQIMRKAGFSDAQIEENGTDLRNALAQSGAAQVIINGRLEAVFAINRDQGDCVYIATASRGNFIFNVKTGWVGSGG
jgi:hypothetical protein